MFIINTPKAPAAIGPYSQAIIIDNFLFTSGQIPINPSTGEVVNGNITVQAEQVMKNLDAILNEAGICFSEL
nr:Rid family hydrolase [Clostridioides mangenotii]